MLSYYHNSWPRNLRPNNEARVKLLMLLHCKYAIENPKIPFFLPISGDSRLSFKGQDTEWENGSDWPEVRLIITMI